MISSPWLFQSPVESAFGVQAPGCVAQGFKVLMSSSLGQYLNAQSLGGQDLGSKDIIYGWLSKLWSL